MDTRRDFIKNGIVIAAATAAARSGMAQSGHAAAGPATGSRTAAADGLELVHPEFRAALRAVLQANAFDADLSAATLMQMRKVQQGFARPLLPAPVVTKRSIPGPKGSPDVVVYIAGAKAGEAKPAMLHMHGGGYVAGSAEASRRDMQDLAAAHNCVAISVEYRLAPETPFPGSLEDNYAALQWMYKNAAELGVDRTRIAIKGESAGGGHAAALAIAARDRGEVPICLQVLVYPMLDDRTASSVAVPPSMGQYIWTRNNNRFGWTSLLGRPAGSAGVPVKSVPARVDNLTGLAPAWIGVGSIDLFVGEDIAYGRRLMDAAVPTEMHVVPGGFHAFDIIAAEAPLSVAFAQAWSAALARASSQQM